MTNEAKTRPVVVTMTGRLDIPADPTVTASEILQKIEAKWGIGREYMQNALIAVHDAQTDTYRKITPDMQVGETDSERFLLRVVIPLTS